MEDQTDTTRSSRKTKRTKRLYAALAAAAFLILVVAIFRLTSSNENNDQNTGPAPVAVVHITKTGFEPATLSVRQGTRVIWTNTDSGLHQVASNPYPKDTILPSLKSEILNSGQSYEYYANSQGTYGYHDQMQPTINGTLVVQKP